MVLQHVGLGIRHEDIGFAEGDMYGAVGQFLTEQLVEVELVPDIAAEGRDLERRWRSR